MEDLIGSALNNMKGSQKKSANVQQQIQLQNDLEYVAAFGVWKLERNQQEICRDHIYLRTQKS